MGFRFRRSVKIAPGLRLNFGKRGVSVSAGPRGAMINVGRRGTRLTTSIPGTGISYSQNISAADQRQAVYSSDDQVPRSTAAWLIVMSLGFFAMLTKDPALTIVGWLVALVSLLFAFRRSSFIVRVGGAFLLSCMMLALASKWGL